MKKTLIAALGALTLCGAANAGQLAQTADASGYAKLTDANVLMTDGNPAKAQFTKCQPLKGEIVAVLEIKSDVGGMTGVNAARVVVTDGECKGVEGWVGLPRLEKVAAPTQQ